MILVLQIAAGIFLGCFAVYFTAMLMVAAHEYRHTGRWPRNWF